MSFWYHYFNFLFWSIFSVVNVFRFSTTMIFWQAKADIFCNWHQILLFVLYKIVHVVIFLLICRLKLCESLLWCVVAPARVAYATVYPTSMRGDIYKRQRNPHVLEPATRFLLGQHLTVSLSKKRLQRQLSKEHSKRCISRSAWALLLGPDNSGRFLACFLFVWSLYLRNIFSNV